MDGLRFECQSGCTNCCRVKGYVYLTEADAKNAASFLGITPDEFERKYLFRTKYLLRLRKPPRSQCHFLRAEGCSIHPAKPSQCRAYPFWPELVENREAWSQAGETCPGIGRGPLIQIGTAMSRANEMRTAYPAMYDLEPIDEV